MKKRALVAMSGGVDSSVCAYLAGKAGYECVGVTMKLCEKDINSRDAEDAAKVCSLLGMEHYVLDCTREFKEKVIDNFVDSYENGKTPNPCIVCNKHLKFGLLFDKAKELGCDTIVTGHYARIVPENGSFVLKKAKDIAKDQSYVLYPIARELLSRIYLPLGELSKDEVRAIAEREGFVTARKSDSQDICFVPDGNYPEVIAKYSEKTYPEGNFVDTDGNILGKHKGIICYTVGQRKGLGIAFGKPMYVKSKDVLKNEVILADNDELFQKELTVSDFNLLEEIDKPCIKAKAKVRYNQTEQDALVCLGEGKTAKIVFDKPQRAIAPGQSAVVYDGDTVIGGGIID